jgi:hypothetical protein
MKIEKLLFKIIEEENITKTTKTKPIVDAIKNRNKISFYYSGPRKPKKDSVKPGYRVKAEAVALGVSKKGNLIIRAYVQPPSTSKTGFGKHGWRTFMVSRMNNVQITDDVFNEKRPGYNPSDDNSMTTTYVTSDWTKTPEVKKPRIVKPSPTVAKPISTVEPKIEPKEPKEPETTPQEPKKQELPQPKSTTKPEKTPEPPKEEPKQQELPQPKPEEKPSEEPNPEEEDENTALNESIKRIKRLML